MRYQNMSENLPITRLIFQKKKVGGFYSKFLVQNFKLKLDQDV